MADSPWLLAMVTAEKKLCLDCRPKTTMYIEGVAEFTRVSALRIQLHSSISITLSRLFMNLAWYKNCRTKVPQFLCVYIDTYSKQLHLCLLITPNRYERVSQTSYRSPLTRNAINPRCVIRAILLYVFNNSFRRCLTASVRAVASSIVCGG